MVSHCDLLIRGGYLVDPGSNRLGRFDVSIEGGRVVQVGPELSVDGAREVFEARGRLVLPGLVDTHVHLTPPERAVGHKMLARAGVTCCLDCGGTLEEYLEGMAREGAGISAAVINRLDPGVTISGPDASRQELSDYLESSLDAGALGLKLLGGHLPLSPDATTAAIEVANRAGAYAAFHCGSTRNGSNLLGFQDALEFTGGNRIHICHVTAYCRGLTLGSPVEESMAALKELSARPHIVSESHMAPYNGTGASLENGVPRSHVTRTCLKMGGYDPTCEGLLAAVREGHTLVQKNTASDVVYLEPEDGVRYLEEKNFETTVSFSVNRRSTAFLLATEKNEKGGFIVTALSTDGGGIPRNFLLSHGLSLVRFEALTLLEMAHKCCLAPARMLGLKNKGHLGVGADADLVVADFRSHEAVLTVAAGRIIMVNGLVVGRGGTVVTTERGKKALARRGISATVVDLSRSLFYTAA
ncbi:MAG: amidohydrolase family protein [Deltaproteobacteria bacterium]|nr:amidohydrolase family protein [Deltaproteobacteria bacterium]